MSNAVNRRELLISAAATSALATTLTGVVAKPAFAAATAKPVHWISTTQKMPWRTMPGLSPSPLDPNLFGRDFEVRLDQPKQQIDGFGGAFTEKGWDALASLAPARRDTAMAALFGQDGAAFTLCRTPIGANDISRKWYSYDETPDDFALKDFSIANDRETLIPYIRAAMQHQKDLRIWASPWSPPTWMKKGKHYAQAPAWPGQPSNGILPEQMGKEGVDSFILEDRYLEAYARYFRRYVEEYKKAGVPISMVMPQNEFNSAQPFPSCCWTPEGLARFIPFLGKEMGQVGVDIFFGTLERPNADLLSKVLADPKAGPFIKGVGVQWAGKGALSEIQRRHPNLTLWASEQECGVGTNDWHYARYSWGLMRKYFNAGASAWHYWNMAMPVGGMSSWGWPQNALITVDTKAGTFRRNHEYYLMRHLSQYVQKGARMVPTESYFGFENQLAFRNPDGRVVVVVQNEMAEPQPIRMKIGDTQVNATLPADSFNTFVTGEAPK
jgi:glucosylceramidase